jgi:hypothetical protein
MEMAGSAPVERLISGHLTFTVVNLASRYWERHYPEGAHVRPIVSFVRTGEGSYVRPATTPTIMQLWWFATSWATH